jgi:hypothetical protein
VDDDPIVVSPVDPAVDRQSMSPGLIDPFS